MTNHCQSDPSMKEIHEVWEELVIIFQEAAECSMEESSTS